MKKNKYKILSIKSGVLKYIELMILILCSVVGVGFISGAEIYEFFVQFGDFYILGILTFLILSFVIIYKILKDIMFENYDKNCNFLQNNNKICVKNTKNGIKFNKIMKDINSLFNVVIISGTMFSGLKHLVRELCCNNYILVYLMVLLSVFLLFIIGVKWLSKIELMVIVFILFMLVSFLCDENFSFNVIKNINKHIKLNNNILLSIIYAGLYVFMNYFQIKPLIISSGIRINNKNNCKYFSLIFSIIITILLLIFSLFLKNNNYLISNKMPFLEYFGNKNKLVYNIFVVGLFMGILSTLVSCLIGIREYLKEKLKLNYIILTTIIFVFSSILGIIDFHFYVKYLYPLLGFFNLIIFIFC